MENEILQAIVLGIVQGLTEFLPISSSGHLVLTPWLFGWEDPGLSFNVALHIGTLLAVLVFFWRDWRDMFSVVFLKKKQSKYPKNFLWIIVLATIPGVFAGALLNHQAETYFRSPLVIAWTLMIFGFFLFWGDKKIAKRKKTKKIEKISFVDGAAIGLAQALAIVPGVSRSGVTITAGLFRGIERKSAARFSFLLSTPIIFGAAVYQMKDFVSAGIGAPELIGILASAISGFFAIKWLIKFIEHASYQVFFWYRLVLATIIILMYYLYA